MAAAAVTARAASAARRIRGEINPQLQLAAPAESTSRGCARTPSPDDGPRRLVISHPFLANGERSNVFEVLDVSPEGALSRPGRQFEMGNAVSGSIQFTPDGEVGLVALDDGKIGVFRLDAAGHPTVVHEGFKGAFDAGRVVMEPGGDSALVIDRNWRERGGGVYRVTIGCDGSLTDQGRILAAKSPGAVTFVGQRAVVAAVDAGDLPKSGEPPHANVHLVDMSGAPRVTASADIFGYDIIVGGAAMTSDGRTMLVGDVNGFGDFPNRVAAVDVSEARVRPSGLMPVENPEAIATSPFGDVAVVASPMADAIQILDRGGPQNGWRVRGPVPYADGRRPQLPGDLATIDRGRLRGTVFVSENVSVRRLEFQPNGSVVDRGSLELGEDFSSISGAIGVTK